MHEFKLPDPGEGLLEADIVSWKVSVGDTVAVNDTLLEIETAKSLVELPSPYAGVVAEILVAEGTTVEVGAPIIRIRGLDEAVDADAPRDASLAPHEAPQGASSASAAPASPSAGAPVTTTPVVPANAGISGSGSNLVGYGTKAGAVTRRARRTDAPAAAAAAVPAAPVAPAPVPAAPAATPPASAAPASAGRPLAKPPVRRVARDLGVDLSTVAPTGPGGTITADDVVAAASNTGEQRIPLRGVRKEMFRAMTASLAVPQATAFVEVDVTATVQLIETLKRRRDFTGLRISPLAVFAKAACLAIERVPELNSSYDAERNEIVLHEDVNLGIAAATPRGLLVPNIKRANEMNLLQLTQAINELVPQARSGKVPPEAMSGGTFSITNVGVFGVDGGTPIPNNGEAAIMCLGTILRKPWVVGEGENERIEPRSVCTVTVTFDHRLVDGEMGSKFLADVSTIMSDPALALLF
ncbi:MAG: 2-oxo acid dehydrogenase subunit E2 [Actinobacteria bacterium]|nr:2-oxo acid dehydrogenase subunit E2 [Actinomycetota bacterium]